MGSLVQASGDIFSGLSEQGAANAQKNIARNNADIAEQNAQLVMQSGESQVANIGMRNKAQSGAIKTAQASSGVDLSSNNSKDVRTSQQALGLYDTMTARSNAAREAFGYKTKAQDFRNEAALAKTRANQAMWAAGMKAASSLAGGANNAMSAYKAATEAGADNPELMAALAF